MRRSLSSPLYASNLVSISLSFQTTTFHYSPPPSPSFPAPAHPPLSLPTPSLFSLPPFSSPALPGQKPRLRDPRFFLKKKKNEKEISKVSQKKTCLSRNTNAHSLFLIFYYVMLEYLHVTAKSGTKTIPLAPQTHRQLILTQLSQAAVKISPSVQ